MMRTNLNQLGLGEVALQEFGAETDVLIRIARQEGDEEAQQAAVLAVQNALDELIGEGISYRRTEFVGPRSARSCCRPASWRRCSRWWPCSSTSGFASSGSTVSAPCSPSCTMSS
jgi:preprotein translocase subunit SecF